MLRGSLELLLLKLEKPFPLNNFDGLWLIDATISISVAYLNR